jgi:hypothetical protein
MSGLFVLFFNKKIGKIKTRPGSAAEKLKGAFLKYGTA